MKHFLKISAPLISLLALWSLASCYKVSHDHENHTKPEFDILLKQDQYLSTITGNIRDSVCSIYLPSNATPIGIRILFQLTKGVPAGEDINCTITGVPSAISMSPTSFKFGLSYTWYPGIYVGNVSPGTYPIKITVTSPTYGTEMHYINLKVF